MKRIASAILLLGVWLFTDPSFISAGARRPPLPAEPFAAVVNGRTRTGLATIAIEEVPCISLRDAQKIFGGREIWRRVSQEVVYRVNNRTAEFTINTSSVVVDGKEIVLTIPVRFLAGDLYFPQSLIFTEEFQAITETTVVWEADRRLLAVETKPGLSSPQLHSLPEKSRVIVDMTSRVHHRVLRLKDNRLTIRFYGGTSRTGEVLQTKDGFITAVDMIPRSYSCDMVITLSENAGSPKTILNESPRQLIVEAGKKGASDEEPRRKRKPKGIVKSPTLPVTGILPVAPTAPTVSIPLEEPVEEIIPTPAPENSGYSPIKTIVIDPGHGGKDVGAVGPRGTYEKDVNLRLARALAKILEKEGRFKVIITRNDDTFIPLQTRAEIANDNKADLFVSIHCNASISNKSNGLEVYFLSEKATDDAAAAVARRENAVVEMEGITDKAKLKVQELLWSLARTETLNESAEMAGLMIKQADQEVPIPIRGVKQAGFYVLKWANMPAVLVESGFITHPKEEALLRSSRFQKNLVQSLYEGIKQYEKRKIQVRMKSNHNNGSAAIPVVATDGASAKP